MNEALNDAPDTINKDAIGSGWIAKVRLQLYFRGLGFRFRISGMVRLQLYLRGLGFRI